MPKKLRPVGDYWHLKCRKLKVKLMGKHKPRTFENRMLKEIFGTDGGSKWGFD